MRPEYGASPGAEIVAAQDRKASPAHSRFEVTVAGAAFEPGRIVIAGRRALQDAASYALV
jgi:hypothetical protein